MKLKGVYTALVTPVKNQEFDFTSLRRLIDKQVEAGVTGVIVFGSTGAFFAFDNEQRKRMIKEAVSHAAGRVEVLAGMGCSLTAQAVLYTQSAQEIGVDGVMIMSPAYNLPGQAGIRAHYEAIHNNTDVPIIIYNNPERSGIDIEDSTIVELSKFDRIVAVKNSVSDLRRYLNIRKSSDIKQLCGDDLNFLASLAHGATGLVSVASNIIPSVYTEIFKLFSEKKCEEALHLQMKFYDLCKSLFIEGNPSTVKYAASIMGIIDAPEVKLPLLEISDNAKRIIEQELKKVSLI